MDGGDADEPRDPRSSRPSIRSSTERSARSRRSDTSSPGTRKRHGPLFFDRIVKQYPEATIFPRQYFFPKTAEERRDAYAVHHEAGSWKDPAAYRYEIEKLKRRVEKAEKNARRWKERYLQARHASSASAGRLRPCFGSAG